jgi:Carboxypeptidase regulatory-like domain/TonB-dependent Receptor Plug Domain
MPASTTCKNLCVLCSLFFGVVLLAACLAVPSSAFAQTELAGVYGRVTDQSGAVVVGAEVEIKNVETSVSTTVKTNGDGLYTIPSLHPGHYLISVRKPGFKSVTVTELELNIQDNVVRNFALQVGSISETVTITSDQFHMNTTDASVSTVVDQSYIKNMPLNGRSFQDLILLTPGVVTKTPQVASGSGGVGEFSVNGQRTEENYYSVDGVSGNVGAFAGLLPGSLGNVTGNAGSGSLPAGTALGTTQALVSVDDLQEFRVESSTYSAEYGRTPGGQFAFETKSGVNQWHGTASDYLRNGYFDAQDWFNDYLKTPEPALHQNDFGGTLGGPIRRDKTFFFVSYEGLRLIAPQPPSINVLVPDITLRQSAPAALQPVLNAYPLPTPGGMDNPADDTAQYIASWSNGSSINSTSVRFDHTMNDKLKLFFRFSNTVSSAGARGGSILLGIGPATNTVTDSTVRTYTAGATSMFSSRLSNDFRLNYSSNEVSTRNFIDPIGGGVSVDLRPTAGLGVGSEALFCYFDGAGLCLGLDQAQWFGTQRQWNPVDTIGLSLGRHQFKFGADYRRLTPNAVPATPSVGYEYFDPSSIQNNAGCFAANAAGTAYPLFKNFSAFAQDQYRVTPRVTLSMGLRWEVNPPPGATQGLMPYALTGTTADTLAAAPPGTPLWKTAWFNFAPRLGAAYIIRNAPGREMVVRAGGGVFFDTGNQIGALGFLGPGFSSFNGGSGSYGGTWTDFNGNSAASPAALVLPIQNPPVPGQYSGLAVGFAPHLQLPYTLQWNASIEQALGRSQTLTFSFVGAHASRLLQLNTLLDFNNPNTFIFHFVQNGLTSDYDSLQTQFTRRLSQGLTVLASYTWSHCIDYGSNNTDFGYQRGNCDYDVRHNFSGAFSYDLPKVRHGGPVGAILNHWGIDDRLTARTAFPVFLYGSGLFNQADHKLYNEGLSFTGQPVYLYGANCASVLQSGPTPELAPGQGCPGGKAFNPGAFMDESSGFGNVPRNSLRLFGAWQMDMAVRRDFPIRERLKLQFRVEAFNIFNHPNFGTVDAISGDQHFGLSTGTLASSLGVLSPLYQMGGPRSMQFALKLVF